MPAMQTPETAETVRIRRGRETEITVSKKAFGLIYVPLGFEVAAKAEPQAPEPQAAEPQAAEPPKPKKA